MTAADTSVHVGCAACGATNRIPQARLSEAPDCGRCGAPLLPAQPVVLTDATIDKFLRSTQLPVLLDVWAPWCGPCRQMAPAFEAAARQLQGRVVLAKIDSEANPQFSARHGIRSIPTLMRFEAGRLQQQQAGALPLPMIVALAEGRAG